MSHRDEVERYDARVEAAPDAEDDDFTPVQRAYFEASVLPAVQRRRFLEALAAADPATHAQVAALLDGGADDAEAVNDFSKVGRDLIAAAASDFVGTHADGYGTDERMPPLPPAVGPFTIGRELARGGQGAVYEATQPSLGRTVAFKVIRPGFPIGRFETESRLLALLDHPNIVKVIDTGVVDPERDKRPWYAMELVPAPPGGSRAFDLRTFSDDRKLSWRERVTLLITVCRAVAAVHALSLVHRDLKPSNILVTPQGQPKVLDFGIAKTLDATATPRSATITGAPIGTIAYMAPEQALEQAALIGRAADVYALGVIAYELLSGESPYITKGLAQVDALRRVVESVPQSLAKRVRALRGNDVSIVIERALEKEPSRRYADAGKLGDDLQRVLDGKAIEARAASRLYIARRFAMRHRAAVAMAAAVVATLVTATVVSTRFGVRAGREADNARVARGLADAAAFNAEMSLADASMRRGDWPSGLAASRRALALGPNDSFDARLRIAQCLSNDGRAEEAVTVCDDLLATASAARLTPTEHARAMLWRGLALWLHDTDEAIKAIEAAQRLPLPPEEAAFADAMLEPDLVTANAKLKLAVKLDPYNHQAATMLAITQVALADFEGARDSIAGLRRLFPTDPVPTLLLAVTHALRREAVPARAAADEAAALLPSAYAHDVRETIDLTLNAVAAGPGEDVGVIEATRKVGRLTSMTRLVTYLAAKRRGNLPRGILDLDKSLKTALTLEIFHSDDSTFHDTFVKLSKRVPIAEVFLVAAVTSSPKPGDTPGYPWDRDLANAAYESPSWSGDKRLARTMRMFGLILDGDRSKTPIERTEPELRRLVVETIKEGGFISGSDGGTLQLVPLLLNVRAYETAVLVARSWSENEPQNIDARSALVRALMKDGKFSAARAAIDECANLSNGASVAAQLRAEWQSASTRPAT